MHPAYTAHVDTFARDHLPPREQWPEFRFDLPELHYPQRLNCAAELLEGTIARLGADRPCLHSPTETWSYGELSARSNQIAHVLTEDFGVLPGNRVMLRGPNSPWLVAVWFGVLKAGGVVVTTTPMLRHGELRPLIELTVPHIAVCDHRYADDLNIADPHLTVLGFGGPGPADLTARCADRPVTFTPVATAADDVALLAPTSGTTGIPKATMHFHRDVLANTDTFARHVLRPGPDDVFTGTPPIGFTFGLGGLVVFPLRFGAATLLLEKASPAELAEAIARRGVTTLFTAPTMYKALLASTDHGDLKSLHSCVSAGEHLPKAVWEQFNAATGLRIIDGIGGTEMLHIFISASGDAIRPGSSGVPVPGYLATILDEQGEPVADGVAGRLAVKGPTGCRYLADHRQGDYVQHSWNITGDTYIRDADGYFWYQARSDDMIISSGYNIAGPEVEAALAAHPDVLESAVVAAPDPDRGSIVHAFVVLRDGIEPGEPKIAELQTFVKQAIAPYKYPRAIEFLPSLPKTPTGKLQRFLLRQLAEHAGDTVAQ